MKMAKNQEEHAQFQMEIMSYVDRYRHLQKKESENNAKSSESDFLIRLDGKEVVDFSSQYGSETSISYVASNLVGRTFVFPSYGDYTQTCVFRTHGPWWQMAPSGVKPYSRTPEDFYSVDFIEVTFARCLYPVRIEVYETYNPGAIVRILACDNSGGSDVDKGVRWVTLWQDKPKAFKQRPRIFAPKLRKIDFATSLIRLELNHQHLDYYTELDCIKLVGTTTPTSGCSPDLGCICDPLSDSQASLGRLDDELDVEGCANYSDPVPNDVKELTNNLQALSVPDHNEERSFFAHLPTEIIQLILKYLNTRDLCRLSQTCSLLRDHCYDPLLYIDLNLQPYWTQISNDTFTALKSRCFRLQRLNLSWIGKGGLIYSECLQNFLGSCENLQTLELSACKFLESKHLRHIFTSCKNLTELNLSSCTSLTDFSAFSLFTLKKLKKLNLYRTKIDVLAMTSVIRCSPELEHLNIASCIFLNSHIDLILKEMGLRSKNLKSLDLWRMKSVSQEGLAFIYNGCKQLEEIDIGWCGDLKSGAHCFKELAEKCVNLKKVFLTANRTVCDADVKAFARHCPNLEQIDILGTREVTSEAIAFLLEKCKKLIFLDVSFCLGISSSDVWSWRSAFPHVAIKKSFQHISIVD